VGRGERLIKRGDSWFSAKAIDVTPSGAIKEVERSTSAGGFPPYQAHGNFECFVL